MLKWFANQNPIASIFLWRWSRSSSFALDRSCSSSDSELSVFSKTGAAGICVSEFELESESDGGHDGGHNAGIMPSS